MPVDRTLAHDLAERLTALYTDAERRLAADIAQRLAAGIGAPDWATAKLAGLHRLRLWMVQLLRRLEGQMADEVAQAVVLAYVRGGREALDELARLQSTHPEWLRAAEITDPGPRLTEALAARTAMTAAQLAEIRQAVPQIDAVQRLVFSLTAKLRGAHLRITRWAEDAYREVIGRASADVLLGTATRRAAAQRAWEQLLVQGITGFTDRAGRNWNLASYVEMATRSTVAQAAVEGHLDRLAAAGLDLVIVSDAPGECAICRIWEGKVLSRIGAPGPRTVQVPHTVRRGQTVTVHIAGTVAEAILAGLMHPNCRHSLSSYLPGMTKIPTHTADPQGDADRQQLRHLERQLRSWKLREEAVIDPAAHAKAKAKVREYQQRIRDHVAVTGLIRQPHREQINLGHTTAADAGRRAAVRDQQRAARAAAEQAERERRRAERAAQREAKRAAREAERQAADQAYTGPRFEWPDDVTPDERRQLHSILRRDYDRVRQGRFGEMPADDKAIVQAMRDRHPEVVDRLNQDVGIEHSLGGFQDRETPDMWAADLKPELARRAKQAFAGHRIGVRLEDSGLEKVLDDGRFKTQFETGTSVGGYFPDVRAAYERQAFGLPLDLDPKLRPVYGYLMVDGPRDTNGPDGVGAYGDIQVVLKPELRLRTTAQVGDSLDQLRYGRPSPVNDPDWMAFSPADDEFDIELMERFDRDYTSDGFKESGYIEAQVHGGVTVDDIEEIIFPQAPGKRLRAILKRRGIPWRIYPEEER